MILELGAGSAPIEGAIHHDRVKHASYIDIAHDLDLLPWPWENESFDKIYAIDVFEHLKLEIVEWLTECHRILKTGGELEIRVPAWDNPLSYRDPTHKRVFHMETLDYFDPDKELYKSFGSYYWDNVPLYKVSFLGREYSDLKFSLIKI